jgi:PEP-CTERM motif
MTKRAYAWLPAALFGALCAMATQASATVYTFTAGSPSDAVENFSFTTSLSGAQLDNLSNVNITSDVTAFQFPVNFTLNMDEAGFPIGQQNPTGDATVTISTNALGQITSWNISEGYFASYPAFAGENPDDFYGTYTVTTTNTGDSVTLVTDNDAGFAPPGYTTGTGSFGPVTTAPVPEPSTWAMLLAGIGGLGAAMRSRRRMLTVAA